MLLQEPTPVIFVHGIGASASVWEKSDIADHPAFYISFSNRFASPINQVGELTSFINKILQETGKEKVILICHSMGGLVARKYLVENRDFHKVEKMILLSCPNLGSAVLFFNWLPLVLIILGALGFRYGWPLFFCLAGLIWEMTSYLRGVLLWSSAAWAMRPRSRFLRELNLKELPQNIKYISILSDSRNLPYRLVNFFLFREGGDGTVPLSSQKLSSQSVANFYKLNYSELQISLPHFEIPGKAQAAIFQALGL